MALTPAEKQARYRQRQRERLEAQQRERINNTELSLTVADLNRIIADATAAAVQAAAERFAIPAPQEARRAPPEHERDRGRGQPDPAPESLPTPSPDADFMTVGKYTDRHCTDCYLIAGAAYLESTEARFQQDGTVPTNPSHLRAIIGLLMRRIRWTEYCSADELFDAVAPFRSVCLTKLRELEAGRPETDR
jgi:hypothetical protein